MARRPRSRKRAERPTPLSAGAFGGTVEVGGQLHQVRTVTGTAAVKPYRCPGCAQQIPTGAAHVVVWPSAEYGGVGERRHWHTGCWNRTKKINRPLR